VKLAVLPKSTGECVKCRGEAAMLIHKIAKDRRAGEYQLHTKKVLGFKHWDKRRQKPKR